QLGELGKPLRQVVDRAIGGIARIVVGPAPFDPGLVLLSHDQAQVQQLLVQFRPPARRGEGGVIHLGREEGARGHGPRYRVWIYARRRKRSRRAGDGVFSGPSAAPFGRNGSGILIPAINRRYFSTSYPVFRIKDGVDLCAWTLYQHGLRPIHLVRAAFFVFQDPHHAEEHYGFAEAGRGREEVDPHRRRRRRGGPPRDLHRQPPAR